MTKPNWEATHNAAIEAFIQALRQAFDIAIVESVRLARRIKHDPNKPFSFEDYPETTYPLNRTMANFVANMTILIRKGTELEWELSNAKNDSLVDEVFKNTGIPASALKQYQARNLEALSAFQNRKVGGLGLSDRLWKISNQLTREIELGIDVGLGAGRSAADISRDVRSYLNEPERLFRRVRDARGNLGLSRAAELYRPGQGIYRSSYKNAMRLTRTEINAAYRTADFERYQQLPFIVGIEVRRSNNPYPCIVCDSMKGRYPKDYKFRGNHPQCRCYTVTILATPEEMMELNQKLLRGEEVNRMESTQEVKEVHKGFTKWVNENRDRLLNGQSLPLFIQDNINLVPELTFLQERTAR